MRCQPSGPGGLTSRHTCMDVLVRGKTSFPDTPGAQAALAHHLVLFISSLHLNAPLSITEKSVHPSVGRFSSQVHAELLHGPYHIQSCVKQSGCLALGVSIKVDTWWLMSPCPTDENKWLPPLSPTLPLACGYSLAFNPHSHPYKEQPCLICPLTRYSPWRPEV